MQELVTTPDNVEQIISRMRGMQMKKLEFVEIKPRTAEEKKRPPPPSYDRRHSAQIILQQESQRHATTNLNTRPETKTLSPPEQKARTADSKKLPPPPLYERRRSLNDISHSFTKPPPPPPPPKRDNHHAPPPRRENQINDSAFNQAKGPNLPLQRNIVKDESRLSTENVSPPQHHRNSTADELTGFHSMLDDLLKGSSDEPGINNQNCEQKTPGPQGKLLNKAAKNNSKLRVNMAWTDQFEDSGLYTGEVDEEGRPHGKGKMKYENGVFFEGNWKNGTQDSAALVQRERMLSGFTSWKGQAQKNDKSSNGSCQVYGMEWIDHTGMAGKYTGKVNKDNLPDGKGVMRYDFGLIAEGEWMKGILNNGSQNGQMAGGATVMGGTVAPGGTVIGGGGATVIGGGGMSFAPGMMSVCGGGPMFQGGGGTVVGGGMNMFQGGGMSFAPGMMSVCGGGNPVMMNQMCMQQPQFFQAQAANMAQGINNQGPDVPKMIG